MLEAITTAGFQQLDSHIEDNPTNHKDSAMSKNRPQRRQSNKIFILKVFYSARKTGLKVYHWFYGHIFYYITPLIGQALFMYYIKSNPLLHSNNFKIVHPAVL